MLKLNQVINMTKNQTIVLKINDNVKADVIKYYQDKIRSKTPPYAVFQAQDGDTVVTLYESSKLMFQGPNADLDAKLWGDIKEHKDKVEQNINDYYFTSSIGSDEVGTGDFFGPVIVTAAFVSKDQIKHLESLGINDSKLITDDFIIKVVPKLLNIIPSETIILNNLDY